jgi:hypothetical protein
MVLKKPSFCNRSTGTPVMRLALIAASSQADLLKEE